MTNMSKGIIAQIKREKKQLIFLDQALTRNFAMCSSPPWLTDTGVRAATVAFTSLSSSSRAWGRIARITENKNASRGRCKQSCLVVRPYWSQSKSLLVYQGNTFHYGDYLRRLLGGLTRRCAVTWGLDKTSGRNAARIETPAKVNRSIVELCQLGENLSLANENNRRCPRNVG